jgi:hypothetical protein
MRFISSPPPRTRQSLRTKTLHLGNRLPIQLSRPLANNPLVHNTSSSSKSFQDVVFGNKYNNILTLNFILHSISHGLALRRPPRFPITNACLS